MLKKKILVFSPPFSGHLNILKEMINEYANAYEFKLVVTGWKNIPPDLSGLKITDVQVLEKSDLAETDPALWTFQRVNDLLRESLIAAKYFQPDLILYDFFSLEGNFVGKMLGISSWCSIPAMIGPFRDHFYLQQKLEDPINQQALHSLAQNHKLHIDLSQLEMVSDGLYLPGDINLVWSFRGVVPKNFKEGRHDVPYVFVGNLRGDNAVKPFIQHKEPVIYFSLGTVVMNNLWNQQPQTQKMLKQFIAMLAKTWKGRPYKIVFVTQGKKVLEKYPRNWQVYDQVDQVKVLSRSDVFITHGGSNSFHEALLQKVPMVVIPFFGDQVLVGNWVQELGIGENMVSDKSIDTKKSKKFLNAQLVKKIDKTVKKMLSEPTYQRHYYNMEKYATPPRALFDGIIPVQPGDMLYGTKTAITNYLEETKTNSLFNLVEINPFLMLAVHQNKLPHLLRDRLKGKKSEVNAYTKLLQNFQFFLNGEEDITKICLKGLDFFSEIYRVHFLIDDFDPKINYITNKEISHVLAQMDRFENKVIFYKKVFHRYIPIQEPGFSLSLPSKKRTYLLKQKIFLVASANRIKIAAVKTAVKNLGHPTSVKGFPIKLPIKEQLVGMEELVEGVIIRMQSLQKEVETKKLAYDVLVSIGNGIVPFEKHWLDIGVVLLLDKNGTTSLAKSAAMFFPNSAVQKARKAGFSTTTVGSVIAQKAGKKELAIDPHSYLTSGKVNREYILAKACEKALKGLN